MSTSAPTRSEGLSSGPTAPLTGGPVVAAAAAETSAPGTYVDGEEEH